MLPWQRACADPWPIPVHVLAGPGLRVCWLPTAWPRRKSKGYCKTRSQGEEKKPAAHAENPPSACIPSDLPDKPWAVLEPLVPTPAPESALFSTPNGAAGERWAFPLGLALWAGVREPRFQIPSSRHARMGEDTVSQGSPLHGPACAHPARLLAEIRGATISHGASVRSEGDAGHSLIPCLRFFACLSPSLAWRDCPIQTRSQSARPLLTHGQKEGRKALSVGCVLEEPAGHPGALHRCGSSRYRWVACSTDSGGCACTVANPPAGA